MTLRSYLAGLIVCAAVLYFGYTGGYHSQTSFFAGILGGSYVVYSSVAYAVTTFGRTDISSGWVFFACGCFILFAYIPCLRPLVDLFYLDTRQEEMHAIREIFMLSPAYVSSLCIYRGFVHWSNWRRANGENKSGEPTRWTQS